MLLLIVLSLSLSFGIGILHHKAFEQVNARIFLFYDKHKIKTKQQWIIKH